MQVPLIIAQEYHQLTFYIKTNIVYAMCVDQRGLFVDSVVDAIPAIMAEWCRSGMEVGRTTDISAKIGFRINLCYVIPFILFPFVMD